MTEQIEDTKPKEIRELVYFLLDHFDNDNSYIKIGKCKIEVENDINAPLNKGAVYGRMGGCKTGNPRPLILLGYLYGEEKYFHNVFRHYRVSGEWFNYQPIKGIILNLRLAQIPKALENWKYSEIKELRKTMDQQISWETGFKKKMLTEKLEKKELEIDKYTWDDYIKSYTNGRWDVVEDEIIRNKWRTGRGQLDNNETLNEHRENSTKITKLLDLMFQAQTEIKLKSRNSVVDYYNDVIHEGEPYYNLEGGAWTQAGGISIRNAVTLWKRASPKLIELAKKLVIEDEIKMRDAVNGLYERAATREQNKHEME